MELRTEKTGHLVIIYIIDTTVKYLRILLVSLFQFLAGFDIPGGDTVAHTTISDKICDMLEQNQMLSDILSG